MVKPVYSGHCKANIWLRQTDLLNPMIKIHLFKADNLILSGLKNK